MPISDIIDRFARDGRVADIDKLIKETRYYENLNRETKRCTAVWDGNQCVRREGHLDFHKAIYRNGDETLWRNEG